MRADRMHARGRAGRLTTSVTLGFAGSPHAPVVRRRPSAVSVRTDESAWRLCNRLATLLPFVVPAAVPLAPFALGFASHGLGWSVVLTFTTLFSVGAACAGHRDRWWVASPMIDEAAVVHPQSLVRQGPRDRRREKMCRICRCEAPEEGQLFET